MESNELIQVGLVTCLDRIDNFEVVGATDTGEDGVLLAAKLCPDVILMNVDLPGIDGIEAARQIRKTSLDIKIIITCVSNYEKRILAAMGAGADGYCLKDNTPERLKEAIHAVLNGGAWLDPPVARKLFSIFAAGKLSSPNQDIPIAFISASTRDKASYDLNEREHQILTLIVAGKSNSEIAEALNLSYHTIKAEITTILKKLSVEDRTKAAIKALKENLT